MIETESLPILFFLSSSIWGLMVFVFQNMYFHIEVTRKHKILIIYLICMIFSYLFALFKYTDIEIVNFEKGFEHIALTSLFMTQITIFLLNTPIFEKNFLVYRILFSIASLITFIAISLLTATSFFITAHFYFVFFLINEVVLITITLGGKHDSIADEVLLIITYIAMAITSLLDFLFTKVNLIYSTGILCFAIPLYLMLKYRETRHTIRDQIKAINSASLKEKESFSSSILTIVNLLESKNLFMRGHSEKVSLYATLLGNRLGLSLGKLEELQTAALLHDIGYVGIGLEQLSNKKAMNPADFKKIRLHPAIGAEILSKSSVLSPYAEIVKYHHESWDGAGYPEGLKGKQIPFFARIIQIADTYDALTSSRFYRNALSQMDALIILKSGRGKEFDPELIDEFIKCIFVE